MFEPFFEKPAVEFFQALEQSDKDEVRRLFRIICLNPFWDMRNKFPLHDEDEYQTLTNESFYESGRFTIGYRLTGNDSLRITGIAYSELSDEPDNAT